MFCDGCDLAMTVDERVRTTPDGADLCDTCWDDAHAGAAWEFAPFGPF